MELENDFRFSHWAEHSHLKHCRCLIFYFFVSCMIYNNNLLRVDVYCCVPYNYLKDKLGCFFRLKKSLAKWESRWNEANFTQEREEMEIILMEGSMCTSKTNERVKEIALEEKAGKLIQEHRSSQRIIQGF